MTDTMNVGTPDNLKEFYDTLYAQINALDEALDSTTDQKTAGKRSIRNELVREFEEVPGENDTDSGWKAFSDALIEKLSEFPDRQQAGLYFGLAKALESAFEKTADAYVDSIFEAQPKVEQVQVSDEQIAAMNQQRSALYKNLKTMRDLALMFHGNEADYPLPKVRTGARGPRGKRAISEYSWSINGVALTGDENSLLSVSKKYEYESVAALRKAIQAALVDAEGNPLKDLKDPPNPIVFNLPNGDVLSGNRPVVSESDDDSDEDETDED
jgi:hypothetical protein